ncbi:hypothetical protein Glove_485g18 [Diversispora epigaea]|uniref:Uncharacterized protein n=1 Tax=Diversispora epigaea TaxID=1348612 RepID=A0A397GLC4_9GLOM|nr:hypothetical protein Glove_485g18 [Diversispora epigaea]
MYHLRYSFVLNKTYFPIFRQFTLFHSSSIIFNNKISNKLNSSTADQEIEKILETYVNKKKLSEFKLIRKFEKEQYEKLLESMKEDVESMKKDIIENLKSKKEKNKFAVNCEIEKKTKETIQEDLIKYKFQLNTLNTNFLKLKSVVHIKGIFEQWESQFLLVNGTQENKWNKYFEQNPEKFKKFQNFWSKPDEIDIHFVIKEIQNFYKWLSERIRFAYNIEDEIEWYHKMLTPIQNNIIEHMCKELDIKYIIYDKNIDNIEMIENNDKKDKEIKVINDKVTLNK